MGTLIIFGQRALLLLGLFYLVYFHSVPINAENEHRYTYIEDSESEADFQLDDIGSSRSLLELETTTGNSKRVVTDHFERLFNTIENKTGNMWPPWWNEEKEKAMMNDIKIGIITTHKFHSRLGWLKKSWWTKERESIAEVFTDTPHDPSVTNLIYTHCDTSYHFGLWCKNTHMMKVWKSPRYKHVKWFIRANDDSYYHLENIYDYVSKLDHTVPQVIGDLYCYPPNISYPAGGCGFIFSRAVLDQLDWHAWNKPLRNNLFIQDYWEDALWGEYLNDTKTPLIQHPGITQGGWEKKTPIFKLYMEWVGKAWPFPYRLLATHQAGLVAHLPFIHKALHSLDFSEETPIKFKIPPCLCRHGINSRCQVDHSIPLKRSERGPCRWTISNPKCLGPGPYTVEGYKTLLAQTRDAQISNNTNEIP